jgi:hypothetical protein
MPSGCQNFPLKISLEHAPSWPPRSPCRRRVLLRASVLPFPIMVEPLHAPPSSLTRAGNTVDDAGTVPKPTTSFPIPQQRRPHRARDSMHPTPFLSPRHRRSMSSSGPQCHHPPWARNTITRAIPEPTTPSSSPSPQSYIVYFSLSFWAYKS